jgi:hypothetical protein
MSELARTILYALSGFADGPFVTHSISSHHVEITIFGKAISKIHRLLMMLLIYLRFSPGNCVCWPHQFRLTCDNN